MDDAFQVCFFSGNQRKTILQVKAHLVTKNTSCSGTGTVTLVITGFNDMFKKI